MLSILEKQFSFTYPKLYIKFYNESMLDWGILGVNWYIEEYPKLREIPPFLLFVSDFKIIPINQIQKYAEQLVLHNSEYHVAIPFGKNGAGDLYCFLFTESNVLNCICIINKITGVTVKLAENLEDFMFRELLGAVVQINEDDIDEESDFISDIKAMLQSHKKYLSQGRFEMLAKIYDKPIVTFEDDEIGMISSEDYFTILEEEIYFSELDKKIIFSKKINSSYKVWIEAEEWSEGEWNIHNDNTDVIVEFNNGDRWCASFFTYNNIGKLVEKNKRSGECLHGKYFWASDMILVDKISRERILEVIDYLCKDGEFESVFKRLME